MRYIASTLLALYLTVASLAQNSEPKYINPDSVAHLPGLSQAVVLPVAKLVFLSGQVPTNAKGDLVGKDDFKAQAKQTFENIKAVLSAAGSSPAKIVKINYYVVGLDDTKRNALREIRDQYVDKDRLPASTLAGVDRLYRADVLVEIDVVATLP